MAPNWMDEGQVFLYGGTQATTLQKIGGTKITADNGQVMKQRIHQMLYYHSMEWLIMMMIDPMLYIF